MIGFKKLAVAAALGLCFAGAASAAEYPIGKPQIQNGFEVNAVYLQPVKMEPDGMMRKAEESDIHLEADIRAVAKNPNGFAEGEWIAYRDSKSGRADDGARQSALRRQRQAGRPGQVQAQADHLLAASQ